MRIVSVLPSATEIVCALDHGKDLVGRSEECDFPPEVKRLPIVMKARTRDGELPSKAIDSRVQQTLNRDESLYELDLGLLRKLAPDLLLTQDLCRVCSVTEEEVAAACRSAGIAPRVLSLTPTSLEGVWDSLRQVSLAIGAEREAAALLADLRARSRPPGGGQRKPAPRVAVIEWLHPPILAGLWTPDVVRSAGGEPLGSTSGNPGIRTTWEELARWRPDLVVLSPCSFGVKRTLRELEDPGLRRKVEGVAPARGTWILDEAYFSRPGPRLVEGIRILRVLLDPARRDELHGVSGISPFLLAGSTS